MFLSTMVHQNPSVSFVYGPDRHKLSLVHTFCALYAENTKFKRIDRVQYDHLFLEKLPHHRGLQPKLPG
jgi:hypothetical protein